jgi:uncharacterized protein involved in response to NO
MEPSSESFSAFLARHPTAQYWLLVLLGAFGVYLSMPIAFDPESTLEWIDLVINLAIFVFSSLVVVFGGGLAVLSSFFSHRLNEDGRVAGFAHTLLKTLGIPGLKLAEFTVLGPLGFVAVVLTRQLFGRSISEVDVPRADDDSETK